MKHGKNPTRRQKELINSEVIGKEKHLNAENWLVVKDTPDMMLIIHRASGKTRPIKKTDHD